MIIGAFFCSSLYITAQTPGLGTWNVLTGRFNYNSKWSAFIELQLRSQQTFDHFNYHQKTSRNKEPGFVSGLHFGFSGDPWFSFLDSFCRSLPNFNCFEFAKTKN